MQQVQLQDLKASLGPSGPHFSGWVTLPRGCARAEQCEAAFALSMDELDSDELNRMFNPRMHSRPWYLMWQGEANQPSLLRRLRAIGELRTDRLVIKSIVANNVTAQVTANSGR